MHYSTSLILFVIWGLLSCQEGHAQSVVKDKIRGLAIQQVLTLCPTCEVTVESKWIPRKITRMDSAQIDRIQFNQVGLPRSYQTVTVVFADEGKSRSGQIQLFIDLRKKVPVVNKRIERNQTIEPEDLILKKTKITRMRQLPIESTEKIAGKAAGRLIPKGNVILKSDLKQVPIIEAGDSVKMVYRSKRGFEIEMDCTARQARAKGERIRLYSKETMKSYIGKVLTPSKVIWEKTL